MERKLPGMAPHPSCPGCGRARPPPTPPWRGGGPGPPLTAPTPPAGAEQEAQETWFILQEMRPSVPAISPQPAPLPVTPGWHRGCGEAGGGGSGGSRLPPNPPVPVAASCPGRGPQSPWALCRELWGAASGDTVPLPVPVPVPVPGVPRSWRSPCPCWSPVPVPEQPGPILGGTWIPGGARSRSRSGGAPVPGRGGAGRGRAARRGRPRGMWPPLPPLPRAGSEAGPEGAAQLRRRAATVGAARPGRLRAAHGADQHQGSRYRGLGQERGRGPWVGPNRGDRGSARERVPVAGLCQGDGAGADTGGTELE